MKSLGAADGHFSSRGSDDTLVTKYAPSAWRRWTPLKRSAVFVPAAARDCFTTNSERPRVKPRNVPSLVVTLG